MLTSKKTILACCIVTVALAVSHGFAATLHVDPNDPTTFQSVQEAIEAAKNFDTVVVHPGRYEENIDFQGKPITVRSVDPNDPNIVARTVIGRGNAAAAVKFVHGETSHSVLRGLTVVDAWDVILLWDAQPQIRQCVIRGRGDVHSRDGITGGSPTVTQCRIYRNGGYGVNCLGGEIRECIVHNNGRGGIVLQAGLPNSTLHIANTIVSGNSGGNGIYYGDATVSVMNCTVVGNSEAGITGSNGRLTVTNSIIAWNWKEGISGDVNSRITSMYNNVYMNVPNYGVNTGPGEGDISGQPWFVDNGHWRTTGASVWYEAWSQGDYHLMSTVGRWDAVAKAWVKDPIDSPCIDKGDPNAPVGDEPYPNGGRINMGAYGGTAEASKSLGGLKCVEYPAMDFNHDCKVDQADLDLFMQHWLECGLDDPNACWPQGPPAAPHVQL